MRCVREHGWLFAGSAALALVESVLVVTLAPHGAAALAPQVAAPAPFGVFHDLRWVLVYQPSWWALVLVVLAFLAFRTTVDVLLVRAAWPRAVSTPPIREHSHRMLRFTALQAGVLVLFAVLTFAMAVTSLSWLFFVATPVLVMVALLVHHGEVLPTWWRDRPTRTTITSTLLVFATLTLAGAAISALPRAAVPFVAVLAALGVAWFRLQSVHALASRAEPSTVAEPGPDGARTRRRPFAVIGLAVVLAIVVGGTAIGFAVAVAVESGRTPPPRAASDATGSPVLVVKGFNSRWDGVTYRWVRGDHVIRRFSYRGLDARGRPRTYERDDTHRSLEQLAREMREQVATIRAQTGERVSIVAESEGALVTQVYLAAFPRAPVDAVVLLSPLAEPGRVFYPPEGDDGWGVGTGVIMRVLAGVIGALGPVDVSADAPLFRSITDLGPTVGALLACPPTGLRSYAVLPVDEAVAAPAPVDVGFEHQTVGAFHGGLLGDDATQDAITAVLDGEQPDDGSKLWDAAGDALGAVAAPWQVPGLAPGLEPTWRGLPDSDDCAAVRAELRSVVSRTGSG
jgi:hypothetical protein